MSLKRVAIHGLLLAAACAGEAAAATIYYVSDCAAGSSAQCVVGNDANPGTSPAAPWRTFEKARSKFKTLNLGDQILFARGGSFLTAGSQPLDAWVNAQSRASNPVVIGAYTPAWAPGGAQRPILKNLTGGIFSFHKVGPATVTEGLVVRDLDLRGGGEDAAVWFWQGTRHATLDNLLIDNFDLGVYLATPSVPFDSNDYVTLKNSRIVNCPNQGWLGSGVGVVIENNDFENNGYGMAVFNHNVYIGGKGSDVVVRNNRLYRSTMVAGKCQGVSLVVHGVNPRLLIEGNLVHEDVGAALGGCWGIAVDGANPYAETYEGSVIRGNRVVNVGNAAIAVNCCPDCVVENNVVVHQQPYSVRGIYIPDGTRSPEDAPLTNVTVRNNSVYTTSSDSIGIRLAGEGTGHVVVSNAIYYGGTGGFFTCFSVGLPAASYAAIDYNLCHVPDAASKRWAESMPYTATPLLTWQNASPFDDNSAMADPLFVNPAAADLSIGSPASPVIGAGHPTLSAPLDLTGATRPAPPSIGAFEFQTPRLSVGNATVAERLPGSSANFVVSLLSPPAGQTVTVAYETADGTATTAGGDYTAVSGVLSFPPGVVSRSFAVPVLGDGLVEPAESFFANLLSPVNASIQDGQGLGTITDTSSPKGDFNTDGRPDIVFRNATNGVQNKVWLMNGITRASESAVVPDAGGASWLVRGADDFDSASSPGAGKDGRVDLVFWNRDSGAVHFWLLNGTTRVGPPVSLAASLPANWDLAATGDFDHDGRPDLVWRDFATQKLAIWTMNGTAKAGEIVPSPDLAVNSNWVVVAAADYNNDDNTDFLWYNFTSGKIVTWYMDASVIRSSGQFTVPSQAGDANWKVVASSDYSGAAGPGTPPLGSPDILWRNETSGNQVVWHLDFQSTRVFGQFTAPTANTPALDWVVVGPR